MWPSSNKFGSSHRLQIVHSTQGPTRGARAQQNEPTDVLLSNGSIASDPSIAPEPAAPSYYLLSDALPPLLHQLLTCAHTACLLEARSTHVELGALSRGVGGCTLACAVSLARPNYTRPRGIKRTRGRGGIKWLKSLGPLVGLVDTGSLQWERLR